MKEGALHLCLVYSMLVQYVCRKLATFRQALVLPSFFYPNRRKTPSFSYGDMRHENIPWGTRKFTLGETV